MKNIAASVGTIVATAAFGLSAAAAVNAAPSGVSTADQTIGKLQSVAMTVMNKTAYVTLSC
jgi:hypothetical protein